MIAYDFFRRVNNWHPRMVDELTIEELEWFPVQEAARLEATESIQRQEEARWKQQNR